MYTHKTGKLDVLYGADHELIGLGQPRDLKKQTLTILA